MEINKCLSIKGAEDTINKAHAFEVSTSDTSMFFIADNDKVGTHAFCCLFPRPTVSKDHHLLALFAAGQGGLDQCSRQGHCAALQEVGGHVCVRAQLTWEGEQVDW